MMPPLPLNFAQIAICDWAFDSTRFCAMAVLCTLRLGQEHFNVRWLLIEVTINKILIATNDQQSKDQLTSQNGARLKVLRHTHTSCPSTFIPIHHALAPSLCPSTHTKSMIELAGIHLLSPSGYFAIKNSLPHSVNAMFLPYPFPPTN